MSQQAIPPRETDAEEHQEVITEAGGEPARPQASGREPMSDTSPKQFGHYDEARVRRLRRRLQSIRYTEEAIAKRLQIRHLTAIALTQYPVYYERLQQSDDSLSTAISLFLVQGEVRRAAADAALTAGVVEDLLSMSILTPAGEGMVVAGVSIYPCEDFYFVTDHRFWPVSHQYYSAPRQPVMYLGEDSYALAFLAPKAAAGGRVLDLCTGSGVQAVVASRHAGGVVGVDINPRALEFASLNAALNGVAKRCEFRRGSLYEPVTRSDGERGAGELFDVILANPPFVPSPHAGEERLLYRDGGVAGDEILSGVVKGLSSHLKPGGLAAIMSFFIDQKRALIEEKIKRWAGGAKADFLLFRFFSTTPEEFASWYTWRAFGDDFAAYSERYQEWLGALKSARIERLVNGVLAARLSPDASSSFRVIDAPLPISPQGDAVAREFGLAAGGSPPGA